MTKVVISTVGTSILSKEFWNENRELFNGENITEKVEKQLLEKAKTMLAARRREIGRDIAKLSAEVNCLDKIKIEKGDQLHFLTTETLEGNICGKLVAIFCQDYFQAECTVKSIQGLQVKDAKYFTKVGLNNFVDEVLNIYYRYGGYNVLLNITGGFKAVVPYTTLIGLVFGIPIYYIFERSNQLIRLPSAPVQFDLEILKSLDSVIADIEDDYISVWDFLKATGLNKDDWLYQLNGAVIVEDEMVTLSPLGRLLYKRYLATKGYKILLSSQVKKKLNSGYDKKTFESLFKKMRDPVHLHDKAHYEVKGSNVDCDCYKAGNTSERIFYYIEDEYVKICDIFMHDEYIREINKGAVLKEDYDFPELH